MGGHRGYAKTGRVQKSSKRRCSIQNLPTWSSLMHEGMERPL
jgi:hypothetical protein